MKLKLVSVGKARGGLYGVAIDEYAGRIRRFADLSLHELRADTKEREATAILEAARGKERPEVWALDQRGREVTSEELAQRLGRLRDSARDLSLCIGGDEGLSNSVIQAVSFTWSLSKLTLPHRLARVVVLEQLYRAFEILRGGPYHK